MFQVFSSFLLTIFNILFFIFLHFVRKRILLKRIVTKNWLEKKVMFVISCLGHFGQIYLDDLVSFNHKCRERFNFDSRPKKNLKIYVFCNSKKSQGFFFGFVNRNDLTWFFRPWAEQNCLVRCVNFFLFLIMKKKKMLGAPLENKMETMKKNETCSSATSSSSTSNPLGFFTFVRLTWLLSGLDILFDGGRTLEAPGDKQRHFLYIPRGRTGWWVVTKPSVV